MINLICSCDKTIEMFFYNQIVDGILNIKIEWKPVNVIT